MSENILDPESLRSGSHLRRDQHCIAALSQCVQRRRVGLGGPIQLRAELDALPADPLHAVHASVAILGCLKREMRALHSALIREAAARRFVHKWAPLISPVRLAVAISTSSVSRGRSACSAHAVRL